MVGNSPPKLGGVVPLPLMAVEGTTPPSLSLGHPS